MGGEALALPTAPVGAPASLPAPRPDPGSHQAGMNRILPPYLQMVVRGGLASRARDLLTNSSALAEATIRGQQRLGRGECWGALCPVPWGAVVVGDGGREGDGCPVWESCLPPARHVALGAVGGLGRGSSYCPDGSQVDEKAQGKGHTLCC